MKRMVIGALAGALLFTLTTPVQAQGGFGRGQGPRWSQGDASWSRPMGIGMRNGMGPGVFRRPCPRFAFNSEAGASNAVPLVPGAQSPNAVSPYGRGRGLMNGTGPRALNGTCPRLGLNGSAASAPATTAPGAGGSTSGKAVTK